ncbi:hypothetical protein J2W56_006128 [Nocardia kruczakiae]|uniref:Polyketide cyclase/dehydrase/lipid transport protein n=1 Tax=Nocardia kruczakiae TaxID=261477 RepID=A0ABU1XR71_9NOCA|nr:hypothetical protein [Nocardia kruczakiae]
MAGRPATGPPLPNNDRLQSSDRQRGWQGNPISDRPGHAANRMRRRPPRNRRSHRGEPAPLCDRAGCSFEPARSRSPHTPGRMRGLTEAVPGRRQANRCPGGEVHSRGPNLQRGSRSRTLVERRMVDVGLLRPPLGCVNVVVVRAFSSVGIGSRLRWQTPEVEPRSNTSASGADAPVAWHDVIGVLDRLAPEIAATCRARQVPSRERSLLTGRGWLLDFYPGARLQLRIDWTGGWAFMHRPVPQPGAYRALPGHGAKRISRNDARLHWETRVAGDPSVRSAFTEHALRESFRNQLARLTPAGTH